MLRDTPRWVLQTSVASTTRLVSQTRDPGRQVVDHQTGHVGQPGSRLSLVGLTEPSGCEACCVVDTTRSLASFGQRRCGKELFMSAKQYKPGQVADRSGQVEIVGPRGGRTGAERTVVKGERIPPTPKPGQSYLMVDPTKNGAGRKP